MRIWNLAKHNSRGFPSSLFSEDIMTEIFLWLPLKSLIRFKRLSKRWYFLISHKDSYFRRNYLSTLSSRRRSRIVGSDDCSAIMLGLFYQMPEYLRMSNRIVRFLPTASTQFKKYIFSPGSQFEKYNIREGGGGGGTTTTTTTTTTPALEIINNINPFLSLDVSLDKFLSCCLPQDQDPPAAHQKIFTAASSNGFLLCSLELLLPKTYYLVNPVTMEWVALPKPRTISCYVYVGFVCKGDYPSLDLVEYTIVRLSWLRRGECIRFQILSSGDNEWSECHCSIESVVEFHFSGRKDNVIVSSSTRNSDDKSAGTVGIVVYFLALIHTTMAAAIVVLDFKTKDNLLQVIETPGPDRGRSVFDCYDYIRESPSDDGVIHYVRLCCSTDFEFWDLNTENREWCLKHKASLKTMIEGYPAWTDVRLWNDTSMLHYIHAFHPMNPNLIYLTLYGRMVGYNVETRTLELVYGFSADNTFDQHRYYVYQWPCWPPLL